MPVEDSPVGSAVWIDKGVGYGVVAPVPKEELQRLAEEVQRLLAQKA
jgi:anti-sigma factor RsiW